MKIAILTFPGFNEIDSFVATYMINRVKSAKLKAEITCPDPVVESSTGVRVHAQQLIEFANEADAVLVGSGWRTAQIAADPAIMGRLKLDPARQLIGSQCSGSLILAKLGLLVSGQACADSFTRPLVEAEGIRVLDRPFAADGNIATSGGCLASHYLATWLIWRLAGKAAAEEALSYVAPVGQEDEYIARALTAVGADQESVQQEAAVEPAVLRTA